MDTKTLIGVSTGEYARRADFYDYLNMLIKPSGSYVLLCHDRSPAKARNLIIDAALEHGCSHVLLIDDDMAYKPDSLIRLLEKDRDVVSGLYFSRAYPHQPIIFDLADDDGACFPMYMTPERQGLIPMQASGFGFLLIKLSVFAQLEKPYVRLGELNSEEWCDDIGFFNRLRKARIDSFCDLDCRVGHMGSFIAWPDYTDGQWVTIYDTNGKGSVNIPQFTSNFKYETRQEQ